MRFDRAAAVAVGLWLAAVGAPLAATGQAAADARKAKFKAIGADFKAVNDAVRSERTDAAKLLPAVLRMEASAAELMSWFPAGSGSDRARTRAEPAVWSDAAGFRAAAGAFRAETGKLEQAVRAGKAGAIQAQARALGQTCASCHAKFRAKE